MRATNIWVETRDNLAAEGAPNGSHELVTLCIYANLLLLCAISIDDLYQLSNTAVL